MSDSKAYKNIAKWNNTLQAANTGNPLLIGVFLVVFFFLFLNLTVLNKKSTPGKYVYNLSYIFSELENDVFATVAVVDAKA